MGVHPIAAGGFGASAEAYEQGRPDWPRESIALLVGELGLNRRSSVLDLAAGTGKLTRLLVERAGRTIAVEPVREMRAKLRELLPDAETLDGTAEVLPLEPASLDAVFVGEAFHWFDGDRALAEISRVLRPGGGLALLWNRPRWSQASGLAALDRLVSGYRSEALGDEHRYHSGRWRGAFERDDRFAPLAERRFAHEQHVDRGSLLAYVASISYIGSLPLERRTEALQRAARLIDEHEGLSGQLPITVPYCADVFWTKRG